MMHRQKWQDICENKDYRGCWVALDDCEYDEVTGNAAAGIIVDFDDDLAALCQRLGESRFRNCAVLLCKSPSNTQTHKRSVSESIPTAH